MSEVGTILKTISGPGTQAQKINVFNRVVLAFKKLYIFAQHIQLTFLRNE